jgi:hypothetical protein
VFSRRKNGNGFLNERRWQKAMSAWMAIGFDEIRKRYNLHKAYIGHMVLKFHNFALPFKCKYTAKCKEIHLLS